MCDSLDWGSPLPRSLYALSAKLVGRAAIHVEPSRLGAALRQLSALEHFELVCERSDDDLDLRPVVAGLQGGALTYLSLSGCWLPPSRMICCSVGTGSTSTVWTRVPFLYTVLGTPGLRCYELQALVRRSASMAADFPTGASWRPCLRASAL